MKLTDVAQHINDFDKLKEARDLLDEACGKLMEAIQAAGVREVLDHTNELVNQVGFENPILDNEWDFVELSKLYHKAFSVYLQVEQAVCKWTQ